MVRLFKFFVFAWAFAFATLVTDYVYAQSLSATPTPSRTNDATASATPTPRANDGTATIGITQAITATTGQTTTPSVVLLPTPTPMVTSTGAAASISPLTTTTSVETALEAEPLQGTIIANRSEQVARFFLEGETYQLTAGRSQGMELPRSTTVLNLFNCAGDLPVDTSGCFWDPYLIQQDGFYEIYDEANAGDDAKLMLREAGAPPTGQVWVQNRTGQAESIVFKENVYEILPTSVLEFPVSTGVPAILYVRSCLTIDNQSACEWAPKTLDAGVYYAMVEVDTPGSQSGSTRTTIDLRPVVGEGEESETVEVAGPTMPSIVCNVVVPALNVRSGPGLQYDIISKVRTTDGTAVTVGVTGRSADNEWLTVEASVAEGGWINNSPSFIACNGDVMGLPIVEAPAPPTPQAAPITEAPVASDSTVIVPEPQTTPVPATGDQTATPVEDGAETATPTGPVIPEGQALLIVNNGFQHEMRFTLDQMYRPQDGPSEFDIQPGGSIAIVVYPGDIPFTASTPWSGLSSNASVQVLADQSLTLWLRFESEPGGTWVFRWN